MPHGWRKLYEDHVMGADSGTNLTSSCLPQNAIDPDLDGVRNPQLARQPAPISVRLPGPERRQPVTWAIRAKRELAS